MLVYSVSGGPLLLMELAFLLRSVGAEVCWITIQKPSETDEVVYSLEQKMLVRGVQVIIIIAHEEIIILPDDFCLMNLADDFDSNSYIIYQNSFGFLIILCNFSFPSHY